MIKRKTQEQFEDDVYKRLGNSYQVLSSYPGSHGKVRMRHLTCGQEFLKNVHDIITKSSGCPYCNGNKKALYNEQWVIDNTPFPYHYISGFINMTTKCTFYCDSCQKTFMQTPSRLINEKIYGCYCSKNKKRTHQDFLDELGQETLKHYSVNEKYVNTNKKIQFTHLDCGTTFRIEPEKFLHRYYKQYCPVCFYKKSRGENLIAQALNSLQLNYEREYIFSTLSNRRFDFYLPNLNTCIEFDGQQHYEETNFFRSSLQEIQLRDHEKNQYCIINRIILYRIPYTEINNISKILHEIFEEKRSETIEKYKIY